MSHSTANTERMREMRRARRRAGKCAQCGAKSAFYRCKACRPGHNEEQRVRIAYDRAEARS